MIYDSEVNISRKVVENGNIREERYYIGNFEVFRRFVNNSLDYERTSNNLSDDDKVFARVDVKNNSEISILWSLENSLFGAVHARRGISLNALTTFGHVYSLVKNKHLDEKMKSML